MSGLPGWRDTGGWRRLLSATVDPEGRRQRPGVRARRRRCRGRPDAYRLPAGALASLRGRAGIVGLRLILPGDGS